MWPTREKVQEKATTIVTQNGECYLFNDSSSDVEDPHRINTKHNYNPFYSETFSTSSLDFIAAFMPQKYERGPSVTQLGVKEERVKQEMSKKQDNIKNQEEF